MSTADGIERLQRLGKIQSLLFESIDGVTTKELCEYFDLTQRSIQRDLAELQIPPYNVPLVRNGLKWKIRRSFSPTLPCIQLSLSEAITVLLGLRLVCGLSSERNAHVLNTLEKLKEIFPPPVIPYLNSVRAFINKRPGNSSAFRVFHSLLTGWVTQRKVKIWVRPLKENPIDECLLGTYFIEPGPNGVSMRVVGLVDDSTVVQSFDLDAISRAKLTTEKYDIPRGISLTNSLSSGWNAAATSTEDGYKISVRFSSNEAVRIEGCAWDVAQDLDKNEDGSCQLTLTLKEQSSLTGITSLETAQNQDGYQITNLLSEVLNKDQTSVQVFAEGTGT